MEVNAPLLSTRRKLVIRRGGFSLVEICLALGIIAFALIPLVGLLAVGLDSYHNATMRGRSVQVVNKIAAAIRSGSVIKDNDYAAAVPFDAGTNAKAPITWTLTSSPAATPTQVPPIYFDENGEVTTSASIGASLPRMVAMVILTPPTTQFDAGKAQIAVAWPAIPTRPPTYTATAGVTFSNPQGHDETTISFVPNLR